MNPQLKDKLTGAAILARNACARMECAQALCGASEQSAVLREVRAELHTAEEEIRSVLHQLNPAESARLLT